MTLGTVVVFLLQKKNTSELRTYRLIPSSNPPHIRSDHTSPTDVLPRHESLRKRPIQKPDREPRVVPVHLPKTPTALRVIQTDVWSRGEFSWVEGGDRGGTLECLAGLGGAEGGCEEDVGRGGVELEVVCPGRGTYLEWYRVGSESKHDMESRVSEIFAILSI